MKARMIPPQVSTIGMAKNGQIERSAPKSAINPG